MAAITKREGLEIALDRRITLYDAQARDDGHQPLAWTIEEDDLDLVAYSRCEACGRDGAIRVGNGREWWAGRMRLWKCVPA